MKLSDLLPLIHLPDLIARECGPDAIRGLTRERGGIICDPRPSQRETRPSFSVFHYAGVWHWKRHNGTDSEKGSAYGFLLSLGYSEMQAREELHRLAGMPLEGWQGTPRPRVAYTPPSVLDLARGALSRYAPLTPAELAQVGRLLAPVGEHGPAAQDLRRRGLLGWEGLQVGILRADFQTREGKVLARRGALGLLLTGPDGRAWGLKVRNLGTASELEAAGVDRYVYRLARHGAPAWCSPKYGQGAALLIVEGELNGAAASRAAQVAGLSLDVQGLAGAGGVPHLVGMAGKVVSVYADSDPAGLACLARVGELARAAGAAEVRVLTALPAGDFCDRLGELGAAVFSAHLQTLLDGAELWQSGITGKTGLPQIKAAPSAGKSELWQCGTTYRGWSEPDTTWTGSDGGWSLPGGGW